MIGVMGRSQMTEALKETQEHLNSRMGGPIKKNKHGENVMSSGSSVVGDSNREAI